uniref:Ig-like domain-containing protein n=1 Tax=Maylandia zebra TaxID=106582 RepID=A0A3P9DGS1_9CICH
MSLPGSTIFKQTSRLIVGLIAGIIFAGQIQVIGPSQAVTVMVGDDIILPCHLKPASDASAMTFEWARPDLKPRFVHVWHEGQDLQVNQHSSFKGRTSVDITKLKHGDISLKLSKVKHSDKGYCMLGVIIITLVSPACESAGWYPEPELLWLDGEGNLLSAGPTETLRGPDDLYTVSSRVTVEKRHSNNITCRVQQRNTNQSRETHIHFLCIFVCLSLPLSIVRLSVPFCILFFLLRCTFISYLIS